MTMKYMLGNIRKLLTNGFSDEQLRQFCYDNPDFRPVRAQLAQSTGKAAIVSRLIEYAESRVLLDKLLAWAAAEIPVRYEQDGPYVEGEPSAPAKEAPPLLTKKPTLKPELKPRLTSKSGVNPMAIGGSVIVSVIGPLALAEEGQAFVSGEFKWLFSAIDHFLKLRRGEIDSSRPIAMVIPPHAEQDPQANNQLLPTIDAFDLQMWQGQFESGLKRIKTHMRNLDILLAQEASKGDAGKGDVYLQNQLKSSRLEIVKVVREMAQLCQQAYGILITSPQQVVDMLEE